MAKSHLEIERKFLLKRLPKGVESRTIIEQCYTPKGRYRMMIEETGKVTYIHTIKKQIEVGVYDEKEEFVSMKKYMSAKNSSKKIVRKTRYYKKGPQGLTWEIDKYMGICLIVAEVEMPRRKFPLSIPKFIQKELIMEVTEFNQFKNTSLAE